MAENSKQDILLMAILTVTRDDVLAGANELGIPEEQVNDEVIELVKKKLGHSLGDWREIVKEMVKYAIEKGAIECPLGLVCSPSCFWRGVGQCLLPGRVK